MVEEKEKKESKKEKDFLIVSELPTQQINTAVDGSGKEYDLLTTNEALKEILTLLRKIEKEI